MEELDTSQNENLYRPSNSNHSKSGLTYEQEDHSEHHHPILELLLPSYTHAGVIQDIPADLQH
jgi:hypothetical protein